MKKFNIIATVLALFAPTMLWAGSAYHYARLTAKVSTASAGQGKVYAGKSSETTAGSLEEISQNQDGGQDCSGNKYTFKLFAEAVDGYEFAGWSENDGGAVIADSNVSPWTTPEIVAPEGAAPKQGSKDYFEDKTYYATFREQVLEKYSITFETSSAGTYTVDGASPENKTGLTKPTKMVLASSDPNFLNWVVNGEIVSGEQSYTVTCTTDTTIAAEFLTADQVASVASYADLTAALANDTYKKIIIPTGTEITHSSGTLTIPAGKKLVVDGVLSVVGVLSNNGAIEGAGTLERNYKTVTQSSEIKKPYPFGTDGVASGRGVDGVDGTAGKYVVTSAVSGNTSSINNCTCKEKWFVTIVTGEGMLLRTTALDSKPKGVMCKVNRAKALNWITEIVAPYDNIETALDDAKFDTGSNGTTYDNEYLVVMVDDSSDVYSGISNNTAVKAFALDCAGGTVTFSPKQFGSDTLMRFFNGAVTISCKIMRPHVNFYGCSKASISSISIKYTSSVSLYDSHNDVSLSYTDTSGIVNGASMNFYGGGPYSKTTGSSWSPALFATYSLPNGSKFTKVYWGKFTEDPTDYLADKTHFKAEKQSDNTWVVEEINGSAEKAFQVGEEKYYTLAEALAAAISGCDRISLLADIEIAEDVVVPVESDITLNLAGYAVTGTGRMINRGTLDIVDDSGNSKASPFDVPVVCESGELYLSKAVFGGTVTVDGGKCWFLDGTFTGGIVVGEAVASPMENVKICGGTFATGVYAYGNETPSLMTLCPNGTKSSSTAPFQIVANPKALVSGKTTFTLKAFDSDDEAIFRKSKTTTARGDYDNRLDWIRAIEMSAQSNIFALWGIDCTLIFDRAVNADSVSGSSMGFDMPLDTAVPANTVKSVLLPKIKDYGYAPWGYPSFLPGREHSSLSMSINGDTDNYGTSCLLQMRIASGIRWNSGPKDYSYDLANSIVLVEKRVIFGAGENAAMIRPEVGAATFYATVAKALEESQGATVMLTQDCDEEVVIAKDGTYRFDANGFAFTGGIFAAAGYGLVEKGDGVYVVTADPVAKVVVEAVVSDDWKAENNLAANATAEEIEAVLKEEDENELPKWQNLVIGQKSDEKAAVTAANGGTATTVDVAVTFETPKDENGQAVETGYTVKYAFDKVDGATGEVVENGAGEAQAEPRLDIESVTAEEGPSYFKMRAVLEASDESGVTAEVPVEKTIGVMKVESDAQYTILAVPWTSLGEGAVKASELVHAASLQNGDELIVYSDDGASFNKWTVKNGAWAKSDEVELSDDGEVVENETPEPGSVGLARGKGVWLKRSKPAESPIYLIGQPSEEAVETPLAAAGEKNESWNLVASPSLEPVDVAVILDANKADADRVIVPRGENAAPKNFHWNAKKSKWGYDSTEIVYGKDGVTPLGVRAVFRTDDTSLPAGTGFWYLNSSKESKNIKW